MSSVAGVQSSQLDPQPLRPVLSVRLGVIVGVILAADQVTKFWAHRHVWNWVEPVANSELALGVAGGHPLLLTVVMVVTLLGFGTHLIKRWRNCELPLWVVGTLIGGASGNLVDRAFVGVVRDFIPTPWLILNVADLALLVGASGYASASLGLLRVVGRGNTHALWTSLWGTEVEGGDDERLP